MTFMTLVNVTEIHIILSSKTRKAVLQCSNHCKTALFITVIGSSFQTK